MLTFNPAKRITVEEALKHPYLSPAHEMYLAEKKNKTKAAGCTVPSSSSCVAWTAEELSVLGDNQHLSCNEIKLGVYNQMLKFHLRKRQNRQQQLQQQLE